MALHSYTLTTLQAEVTHACRKAPASPLTTTIIVNDAIAWFCTLHPWQWLQEPLSLDLVISQSYVDLPTDFGQLLTLHRVSPWRDCQPVNLDLLQRYRSGSATFSIDLVGFIYAVSTKKQSAVTALPKRRLELYPTPSASETGGLIGTYNKIVPALSGGTDVPDVPADYHEALMLACRAFAVLRTEERRGEDYAMLMEKLPRLIERDGGIQTILGEFQGAIDEAGDPFGYLYPTSIATQ